jgi:hypothetical protein
MHLHTGLDLHEFSSFFEMFAVLNLAYAGSEHFRVGLNVIFSLGNVITDNQKNKSLTLQKKINDAEAKITVSTSESYGETYGVHIQNQILEIKSLYYSENNAYYKFNRITKKKEKQRRNFYICFKSMFLFTGIFCLYVLIVEGYNQFYINDNSFVVAALFPLNIVFIFNIYVFLKSFGGRYMNETKLKRITLAFIFCLLVSFFITFNFRPWLDSTCERLTNRLIVTFTILISISPYILHFIRVWMHKWIFRIRYWLNISKREYALKVSALSLAAIDNHIVSLSGSQGDMVKKSDLRQGHDHLNLWFTKIIFNLFAWSTRLFYSRK